MIWRDEGPELLASADLILGRHKTRQSGEGFISRLTIFGIGA